MSEIVSVHVGQCGNEVGTQFWQLLRSQHGLDQDGLCRPDRTHQLGRISTYFSEEKRTGRFLPRSVLVDLEPGLQGTRPEVCVRGQSGSGNNWARAHYGGEAAKLRLEVSDVMRREAEQAINS